MYRRYSQFRELYRALKQEVPETKKLPFPNKKIFFNKEEVRMREPPLAAVGVLTAPHARARRALSRSAWRPCSAIFRP